MKTAIFLAALAVAAALAGCGGGDTSTVTSPAPATSSLALARTVDAQGQSHTLSLTPTPAFQAEFQKAVRRSFSVITTSTHVSNNLTIPVFTLSGDVAIDDWRFGVDFAAQGEAAPILIMKFQAGALNDLAADLSLWTLATTFNADPPAAQKRLMAIINTAIANATSGDPKLQGMYGRLMQVLIDPEWMGILILNPMLPVLPAVVLGRPSGLPVGQPLVGHHLGVNTPFLDAGAYPRTDEVQNVFGLVDYTRPPASAVSKERDASLSGIAYLYALFANSALTFFDAKINQGGP